MNLLMQAISAASFGAWVMKRAGQNLITYNLRKSLLYLQRAKMMASQAEDKETAYAISLSISQISDRLKKINEEK